MASMLPRKITKPSGKSHAYYRGWMSAVAEWWVYFKDKPGPIKRDGLKPDQRVQTFQMQKRKRSISDDRHTGDYDG
jgi:hypothetical protein